MPEPHPVELFIPEIKQLIAEKNLNELKSLLSEIHPIDLAEGFHNFTSEQQLLMFKLLKSDRVVEVFEELDVQEQQYLIQHLEDQTLSPLLEGTPPEVTAQLFKKLSEKTVKKMEKLMKKERFEIVRHQLEFPANSAGSRMRTNIIGINPELTSKATLENLQRSTRAYKEDKLDPLYVTNGGGKLIGWLTLTTLISAPQDIKIRDIMSPVSLIKISAKMDQEDAAKIFSKYNLISAPVIDEENRLIGVLNVDDMLDVVQEEATEDIAKLAGTKAEELETGSFLRVSQLRMPWLMASYLGGIIASFIVGSFEGLLAQMAPLITFIPVIAGMGGNVGTQSSTIVVRGLATGRIQIGEIIKILRREFLVGLTLGFSYGLCLGGIAYFQFGNTYSLMMPFVVGVGILTSMTVAATMGTLTPIFFKKLDIDPAAVSAPFVSTTTDIISISVYLLLGSFFLM